MALQGVVEPRSVPGAKGGKQKRGGPGQAAQEDPTKVVASQIAELGDHVRNVRESVVILEATMAAMKFARPEPSKMPSADHPHLHAPQSRRIPGVIAIAGVITLLVLMVSPGMAVRCPLLLPLSALLILGGAAWFFVMTVRAARATDGGSR